MTGEIQLMLFLLIEHIAGVVVRVSSVCNQCLFVYGHLNVIDFFIEIPFHISQRNRGMLGCFRFLELAGSVSWLRL